jgi:hypothetical protein
MENDFGNNRNRHPIDAFSNHSFPIKTEQPLRFLQFSVNEIGAVCNFCKF